jgi:(2Fe-2S) ferredoxin
LFCDIRVRYVRVWYIRVRVRVMDRILGSDILGLGIAELEYMGIVVY